MGGLHGGERSRTISPDTEGIDLNNPQTLNRYSYCLNNPLNSNDPTGHWSWKTFLKVATIVVAVVAVVTVAIVAPALVAALAPAIAAPIAAAITGAATGAAAYTATKVVTNTIKEQAPLTGWNAVDCVTAAAGNACLGYGTSIISNALTSAATSTSGAANIDATQGFDTSSQFKAAYGSAGEGNEWHHIIEQSQITKSGFDPRLISNPVNMIPIDAIDHAQISGYYSSNQYFSDGMRVRDWLAGQSFQDQYNFGMDVLHRWGY